MNIARKVLRRSKTLDRQVKEVFNSFYRRVNVTKLVAALNERLRHHAVRFCQRKVSDLGPCIALTGYCDTDDRRSEIVVSICYSDPTIDLLDENPYLALEIVAVMVHELTHREQQKKRPGIAFSDFSHDAEYLALPDEIDAFANDFAYFMNARKLTLNKFQNVHIDAYRTELAGTKALNRLYKKIYKNLDYLVKR